MIKFPIIKLLSSICFWDGGQPCVQQVPPCQLWAGVAPSGSLVLQWLILLVLEWLILWCRRLGDNGISAGLGGRLQPAQQGLIKSEIPAVFSWALAWDAMGRESVKGNKDN